MGLRERRSWAAVPLGIRGQRSGDDGGGIDLDILGKFGQTYPMCEKGIELLRDDSNPKTIEQALRQLHYAVTAKALDAIHHQLIMLQAVGDVTHISVVVPIIVTTAELWRLKPGTTVESIRDASEIVEWYETRS